MSHERRNFRPAAAGRRRAILAALVAAPLALAAPAAAHVRITTDLTWSEDVRPILRRYCMGCHSPGGPAPDYVDLRTYGTDSAPGARAWAAAIEEEILTGRMPPWQADPRFDHFANTRRMTQDEIDTVVGWIQGGAPQGPRRNLPPPSEFDGDAWQLGEPDHVVAPAEPAVLAAEASETTTSVVVPLELEADTWVTGFEFRPAHPRAVYRMAAWIVDPPAAEPERLEVEIQVPYDPFRDQDAEEPTRLYELPRGEHFLGQWLRGDAPVLLPDGMGRRLRQGSSIRLDIAYRRFADDPAVEIRDQSRLGLFLARRPDEVDLIALARAAAGGGGTGVGDADREWLRDEEKKRRRDGGLPPRAVLAFDETVRLVSLHPDLGTAVENVEIDLYYPDGRVAPLLVIDDYDPEWPASFHLREPVVVPPGSRLVVAGSLRGDAGADGRKQGGGKARGGTAPGGDTPGQPFGLAVSYAIDDHLVLPDPVVVATAPRSQGGMLLGADAEGAADLLKRGGVPGGAVPSPADARAAAHMDHSPLRGGQFFMAANNYHHLEGALPKPGEFHLYLYDDFKQPLDPRNFAGDVVFEQWDAAKSEWIETSYPLEPGPPGAASLAARIPDAMPAEFYASVWLAGERTRFDFYFEEPSRELGAADLARYAALGPHSHLRPPLVVPERAADVVVELERRTELLRQLVERREWLALHVPAFDAMDLAQALLDKLDGLSPRDRGRVRQAVGRTLHSAAELDRAGDLADGARALRAFARYDEAVRTILDAF